MITFLRGSVLIKTEKYLIVDTGSLGYRVSCPPSAIESAEKGKDIELFIHHYQTENSSDLYGFLYMHELDFFEQLIGISGVGPKSAIGILSTAPVEDLQRAIAHGDASVLTRVSGIGKKTADRVIVELKEKMEQAGVPGEIADESFIDALEALVQLGYSRIEARKALREVSGSELSSQERLKEALKVLGKK